MKLEQRYYVVKVKDVEKYLTKCEQDVFIRILSEISECREKELKNAIEGIFIEKDWPEYEPTLELLSKRVDNE